MIIGIDLGTTNCVAAHMSADGPRLIPNARGEFLTPSVFGIDDDGNALVGRAAREWQVTRPERCAALFKRHMGSDWTTDIAGREFTPEMLSAAVLRSLKQDAEAFLGGPVHRAVITVPAYFNEHQRKATIRAGRIADLHVERILNEPTAAAIAYGIHEADSEKVVLIFDLGGGTFDVSIVDMFEGTLEVRSSAGETFLGGEDFTGMLAARILESRGRTLEHEEASHPQLVSRLRQECESVKRRLSRDESVVARIPSDDGTLSQDSAQVTVTRADFHKWTGHILGRTALPIRKALGDASLRREDVDEVILVGGATRMPAVIEQVTELFGRQPRCTLNPDEVVAIGAAIQAGLIERNESVEDLVVTDVAPFTLGVEVSRRIGGIDRTGYFCPIINRNTTIPVSRVERMATVSPNQTILSVRVFQGESRRVENNIFLGEFDVTGVPLGPAGQEIDVRFTYDLNGVLEVEACIVATKRKVTHVITRHARGLSEAAIRDSVREMQSLKTHPREETVNRFLVRRAERVFEELSLRERGVLEMLLHGFEEALELGDKDALERHRDALTEFLERCDGDDPGDHETYDQPW
jgi:molecular chaperone HscC